MITEVPGSTVWAINFLVFDYCLAQGSQYICVESEIKSFGVYYQLWSMWIAYNHWSTFGSSWDISRILCPWNRILSSMHHRFASFLFKNYCHSSSALRCQHGRSCLLNVFDICPLISYMTYQAEFDSRVSLNLKVLNSDNIYQQNKTKRRWTNETLKKVQIW